MCCLNLFKNNPNKPLQSDLECTTIQSQQKVNKGAKYERF